MLGVGVSDEEVKVNFAEAAIVRMDVPEAAQAGVSRIARYTQRRPCDAFTKVYKNRLRGCGFSPSVQFAVRLRIPLLSEHRANHPVPAERPEHADEAG
jgi:hypothetical protein